MTNFFFGLLRAAVLIALYGPAASELIGQLSAKYRIRDLAVREPEIEETVRRIYEEKLLESG